MKPKYLVCTLFFIHFFLKLFCIFWENRKKKTFFPNKKQTAFGHFLLPIIYPNGFAACFKSVSGGQAAEVGSGVLSLMEELGNTDVGKNISRPDHDSYVG